MTSLGGTDWPGGGPISNTPPVSGSRASWGRGFDPTRLALLELKMWKAYYRRQPARLFALLVQANHEQAAVSWPRAAAAAARRARAAATFGRTGWSDPGDPAVGTTAAERDDPAYLRDIVRGYRMLGLPDGVDADEVGRRELRWWTVRREIGLAAGETAGSAIADLYAELYGVPASAVAEAGRLRGLAAEVRDRGASADPDGPTGHGTSYWPEVGRLLVASYRSLKNAVAVQAPASARTPATVAASNEYAFATTWTVPATPDEVAAVLGDAEALARWWPSVYLEVTVLEPGDERGLGRVVDLYTKGWLPYTLRWQFRVTESDPPRGFAIAASGDFVGRGVWTLAPENAARESDGPLTRVVYDWRILAEKGLLTRLSFLMKPVFSANHRWAMARGEESLRLELARRHAAGDATVLAAIPAPPGPTFRRLQRRLREPATMPRESRRLRAGDP
ncbi:MAG: SRPBCC family protein [Candidatus Limnocylindrales bacterium]